MVLFGFTYNIGLFAQINDAPTKSYSDSLIHLRGYFVRVYKKKEINQQEKARNDRINRKPFRVRIDGDIYDEFFLPIETNNDLPDLSKYLPGLLIKDKEEIYLSCTSANHEIFKEQFGMGKNYSQNNSCRNFISSKYYSLSTTNKVCYQVFYLSGVWLKAKVETAVQKMVFARKSKYIDPSSKKLNVYLLYKLDEYIPNSVEHQKLLLWKELPAIWSN